MKRYHSDKSKRKREQRRKFVNKFDNGFLLEKNNMDKKHPLDCGRSRCHSCHSDKLLGSTSTRDNREEERFKSMVYEQFDHNYKHDDWIERINYFD